MATRHVIVDGSNLATEGRNMPSLAQLDQAVREFIAENPQDVVTVVVDASFGHRIDPSEVPAFEEAEVAGEVVSPPAGAIGRGDAFLLRIAEKTGATVLSNDSFQEFHGEHTWLFEKGRLVGGKPVSGVGWIFMDRTPVRGAKSREVTKEAKRKKRELEVTAAKPAGGDHKAGDHKLADHRAKPRSKSVDRAIARATEEVVEPKAGSKSRRRRGGSPPAEPVNEPLAFITFIAAHPLGSDVVGEVLEYSSHGAFVEADGARCYVPLSAMSSPPPRRAREVVTKGETRPFVVQAFDPQRRGIELALPGFENVSGAPTAETVEAEIEGEAELVGAEAPARGRKRGAGKVAAGKAAAPATAAVAEAPPAKARRAPKAAKKAAAPAPAPEGEAAASVGEAPPARKRAARKAAPGPAAAPAPSEAAPPVGEAPPARKRVARQAAAPVAEAADKAVPKKAPARKAAAPRTAESPEKAAPATKAAPTRKAATPTPTKATPAKKASAAKKASPVKKAAVKKGPAAGD